MYSPAGLLPADQHQQNLDDRNQHQTSTTGPEKGPVTAGPFVLSERKSRFSTVLLISCLLIGALLVAVLLYWVLQHFVIGHAIGLLSRRAKGDELVREVEDFLQELCNSMYSGTTHACDSPL